MGKLYDRRDRDYELGVIDQLESHLSSQVLAGTIDALHVPETVELFLRSRQACNMKLLRSGQLMRDLRAAERSFNRVPSESNKFRFSLCKKAVYWAGKENLERRASEGQLRPGDVVENSTEANWGTREGKSAIPVGTGHDGSCNMWEKWYLSDLREGIWPGLTTDERRENDLDYGQGYMGWLRMLKFNEEIEERDFRSELARLTEEQL